MRTGALDMPCATSQTVHNETQCGRPLQGQKSRGVRSNRKPRSGLEVVGASTSDETVEGMVRAKGADLPKGLERGPEKTVQPVCNDAYIAMEMRGCFLGLVD